MIDDRSSAILKVRRELLFLKRQWKQYLDFDWCVSLLVPRNLRKGDKAEKRFSRESLTEDKNW